jgi:hypothetical protein
MKHLFGIFIGVMMSFGALAETTTKTQDQSKAQMHANTHVQKQVTEKRKEILQDATVAMNQTKDALKYLEDGKNKEAIDALESATGKLEVITSRDPKLSLAAFDYSVTTHALLNDLKTVKRLKADAENLLEDNRVQEASAILSNLKSEMVVSVSNIPLATYPSAMKEAVRLIDQNKIEDAKNVIAGALSTVVVTNTIIPLPVAKADYLLSEAEKLSSKNNRTKEENKRLESLLKDGRTELQMAEELGYGQKSDFKNLYAQLDDIDKKSKNGNSGEGWFTEIKRSISGIFENSKHDKKDMQAEEEKK